MAAVLGRLSVLQLRGLQLRGQEQRSLSAAGDHEMGQVRNDDAGEPSHGASLAGPEQKGILLLSPDSVGWIGGLSLDRAQRPSGP